IPIHTLRCAAFTAGADRHELPVLAQRHRASEFVIRARIRCLDIRNLFPHGAGTRKEIDRSRVLSRLILLVAVDALRSAILDLSPDGESVAVAAESQT